MSVAELRQQVEELDWYHTFELAPGLETPGFFDLRAIAPKMPFPASLAGKRCLDVGTFDGFWAREMLRRGASEVLAIDILNPSEWDWPAGADDAVVAAIGARKARGRGFELVNEVLGTRVERRELSVYDLDPEDVGSFDLVYLGSLLLHLRDPVGALMKVRSVCAETLIVCDAIDAARSRRFRGQPVARLDGRGRPWWWKPNIAGLVRMVESAGFELTQPPRRIRMKPGAGYPHYRLSVRALADANGRAELVGSRLGDPHAILVARPTA